MPFLLPRRLLALLKATMVVLWLSWGQPASVVRALSSSSSLSNQKQQQQKRWKPKIANLEERKQYYKTHRHQEQYNTEQIGSIGFHHVEFYCGDAKSMAMRFASSLGMQVVGMTGQNTGNDQCVSYGLQSDQVRFLLTAPYSQQASKQIANNNNDEEEEQQQVLFDAPDPLPGFSQATAHAFFAKHGLAARAVGLEVQDAKIAFVNSVQNGAKPVLEPTFIPACRGQQKQHSPSTNGDGGCYLAEVQLYDDVVLRYVQFQDKSDATLDKNNEEAATSTRPFLPHLAPMEHKMPTPNFGLRRIDHAVGNVPDLLDALTRVSKYTGFHEFAEFTPEDVGTVDSGLNSVVLASDSEDVLLPLNEPSAGKRKSQIQTYLEQNEGAGLQHLALKTDDIFATIRQMRQLEANFAGFELMKRPSDAYYQELPDRLDDQLTDEQYHELEELGILADADEEGLLLQIFTKPIGDRPTFFFEIIQRVGCRYKAKDDVEDEDSEDDEWLERPGCGGFGQGNFRELFRAIEEHEKTLKV